MLIMSEIIDHIWQFYLVAAMFILCVAIIFQRAWYLGLGISFILTAFLAMKVTEFRTHVAIWVILSVIFISYFLNKDQLLNPRIRARIQEEKLVGQVAFVVEDIDNPSRRGVVKIGNDVRTALSNNGCFIPKGRRVLIEKVDGMKVVVADRVFNAKPKS